MGWGWGGGEGCGMAWWCVNFLGGGQVGSQLVILVDSWLWTQIVTSKVAVRGGSLDRNRQRSVSGIGEEAGERRVNKNQVFWVRELYTEGISGILKRTPMFLHQSRFIQWLSWGHFFGQSLLTRKQVTINSEKITTGQITGSHLFCSLCLFFVPQIGGTGHEEVVEGMGLGHIRPLQNSEILAQTCNWGRRRSETSMKYMS